MRIRETDIPAKNEPRELLVKSKVYKFAAVLFAGAGLVVFIVLYLTHMDGDLLVAFREPAFVIMLLVPFLPSAILTFLAARLEKKYLKLTARQVKEQK